MASLEALAAAPLKRKVSRDDVTLGAGLGVLAAWLVVSVALPLWTLLSKSFQDRDGGFNGVANYVEYFANPSLSQSIWNSVWVSLLAAAITIVLAFVYAYGLTRSCMRGKSAFRMLALIPILAPSLLPAISFIYLFGNQGILKNWLFGLEIYGPLGIVLAEVFYCFPHAVMILVTALATADGRLYEAAEALGASRLRIFFTVTLPGIRYGAISAVFVVFTLVITDFGIPKVIGGKFNVLATDVYKQVIGQQNFEMGAVVGMVLLVPALLSFVADRLVQRRQVAQLTARAVPLEPKPDPLYDWGMFAFCAVVAGMLLGVIGMAGWASLIKFWPYNLSLTLDNYAFANADAAGWSSYFNSLQMAAAAAAFGTFIVFVGAYSVEKSRAFALARAVSQFLAMLPLAVPGLVLGLSYIFFFNDPRNPLVFLYGTLTILVINTVAHFYTVSHLTALTALKQIDPEFEAVSASLKVPILKTFWRVTVPVCLPSIIDVFIYLFVNAMTTVSAVIFLYSTDNKLAAVAVVNMEDNGNTSAAAAMAMMIVITSAAVKLLQAAVSTVVVRRTQAWRRR
ncbi:MAG: putative 2-aminoethylphosphonate ABC transporter permease subunit [Alphaproteobacteria bacterium]|nr:putative 2-aminoethylphosphonate ABC transporter permease subunit [Alphaproteobacteria bacterium]